MNNKTIQFTTQVGVPGGIPKDVIEKGLADLAKQWLRDYDTTLFDVKLGDEPLFLY